MARIPLVGGSYSARSNIAGSATRCINLYPEINPKDALVPMTHYQRPGLTPLAQGPNAPVRGLWRATTGVGYAVIGQGFYQIGQDWSLAHLGSLAPGRLNPCSFVDYGATVGVGVVVDGSANGWSIELASGAFTQIVDTTGTFVGADRLDYIDTFMLFNIPGTNRFGSSLSNELVFDPLYIAAKTDWPEALETLIVNRHEILLLGALKSEIWYDAGLAQFPFAELPGAYIEHGIAAKYSVASSDIAVFWLGQDLQGQGVVFRQRGYETKRISNHALEFAFTQIVEAGGTLADAIAYTFQKSGHVFYVLHLPSADQTWVYDDAVQDPLTAWHQEGWTDPNGVLHRHRGNCAAFINGRNVCGDWQNGTIYSMDLRVFTDTVAGVTSPISCVRTFPHLGGIEQGGQIIPTDGKRVQFDRFELDMECGKTDLGQARAEVTLRYSDDRGQSWTGVLLQSAGRLGEYNTWPLYQTLGQSRDRVFEVSYAIPGASALNGAWVTGKVLQS